ncbi:hypothetical protein BAE44_0010708 [Dichanthelium oligosanthes]|uniref:Homologous recombination OB-fold protein OB-fold domain-containing protein n=1 Tax=Dichanthelium oligosanthes TaxID=888268 RepID=A0A1E5VT18_9POAL|nr:hypothetical protein BAE44_0010708 [Dichanthelium oligosanthes]
MAQLQDPAAGWEALDVDDSDIRLDDPPSTSPLTRPCATSTSYSHSHQDKPPHTSHHRRVPGPAAAVPDVARLRSTAGSPLAALGRGHAKAPDADFLLPPWLRALQYLGKGLAWEQPGISVIKDNTKDKETVHRAPLVAGVLTSCKPNGLGDLLVTIKDPSGTIAAAVHKKILLEGNNGQDISVGCVIVLSKVAVFRPTRKACYLNITKVIKVFRKDCDAPSKQVVSSNTTERSEGSTNNIMMRLVDHERMMPNNKMTVTEVSLEHRGPPDSNNSTSAQGIFGRCLGNNQEGGLHMLVGDPRSKRTLNCSTGGHPRHQSLNIPNMASSQPSSCGSRVMFGDRYCTQAGDNENLRRPFDNDKMQHSSKKLKSDAGPPDGSSETAYSRIDTENNNVLERNMNIELDGMAEQRASIREPIEHQQRDFIAANAGSVQPTKEYATTINGSLLNPAVPGAAGAEWTDEQLLQLFDDY